MESNKNLIPNEALAKSDPENKYRLMGGAVILGISGISAIIAGFVTSHIAKKKNREFLKEIGKEPLVQVVAESPYTLAFRALAWGTLWSVGGFSLIMFGVWKWFGFKDMEDLRRRMRSSMKKSPPTDERTEFESLRDLIDYLSEKSKSETKKHDT